ncbi:MAG: radical SAM protein [Tissierellia bacterium]|nr:radical SAM protein [Tissierellia bacterium]
MHKKNYIIPIFIPFLGCPHDCAFCNQVKITNYKDKVDKNSVIKQIENYLNYFNDNSVKREIAFFGGSFTGLDPQTMTDYLKIAKSYKDNNIIDEIRLSTRPDYISISILDLLRKYSVDTIELGIQSMNNNILRYNQRGHSVDDSIYASRLIKEYGFKLGHQIMPGLYKDDFKNSIETAKKSIELKPDMVRIYPTLVIKDTLLEKLYKQGLYKPLELVDAIKLCAQIYILYKYNDIEVIRIGLQPTDNINIGEDVISGPFHAAFRQLVVGYIYRLMFEKIIIEKDIRNTNLVIHASNKDISMIVGNKKVNAKYFYNNYSINFEFISDNLSYILFNDQKISFDLDRFIIDFINNGGDLL